jgi:diaminopimelate decarboxylase
LRFLDIGGGLSVDYHSDTPSPTLHAYADALRVGCPGLAAFAAAPGRRVVTEFGKALVAKAGAVVALVEDVVEHLPEPPAPASPAPSPSPEAEAATEKGHVTAIVHAGADLLLRAAYCPDKFPHRVAFCSAAGAPLTGPARPLTVAGPLCFSGDVVRFLSLIYSRWSETR